MSLNRYDGVAVEGIINSIKSKQLSHAYIIEGSDKAERMKFALEFCKGVFCGKATGLGCDDCINCNKISHRNHEDIYFVEQSNKTGYSVEDVKDLSKKLNLKPATGDKNIAVLEDAERISEIGQNKMLKMLEEPSGSSVILLLTANSENLIDTIISRCIIIKLNQEVNVSNRQRAKALEIYNLITEKEFFNNYREYINKYIKTDDDAISLLNELEKLYRDKLIEDYKIDDSIRYFTSAIVNIEETRKDIIGGMNRKNALKRMYLELGGE